MTHIVRIVLAGICLVLLTAPLWVSLPYHTAMAIDIGAGNETEQVWGFFLFHESERQGKRTFRWMADRGTLSLPYVQRMYPLVVEITACRCFAQTTPTPVDLFVNQRALVTLPTTTQWRTYHLLLPHQAAYPEYGIMLDMRSPTWTDSSTRSLGVALDEITLRQLTRAKDTTWLAILTLITGVVLGGIGYRTRSLLLPMLASISWVGYAYCYRPSILSMEQGLGLLMIGLCMLWAVVWVMGLSLTAPPLSPRVLWVAYPIITTALVVWLMISPLRWDTWVIDDAFISFRYARQVIQGHGLVFNVGERVEGYTNFLWTMLMAEAMALSIEPIIASTILNMLLAFVCVALTMALATQFVQPTWVWVAPLLLGTASPFLLYSTRNSGMETALFTALTLGALLALVQQRWRWAGVLTACTMLTRPDGAILAMVAGCYAAYRGLRQKSSTEHEHHHHTIIAKIGRFPVGQYGLAAGILYTPYFLWRWHYYGYILPNTFYAKVHGNSDQLWLGLSYLWAFGNDYLLLWFGVVGGVVGGGAAIAAYAKAQRQQPYSGQKAGCHAPLVLVFFVVGFSGYVIAVGGDWMPGARFLVVIVPILAIVTTWGLEQLVALGQRLPGRLFWGMVLVVGMVVAQVLRIDPVMQADIDHIRRIREVGRWINTHTSPDALLATEYTGAIPYYADRSTIDVLGLTDAAIAHSTTSSHSASRIGKMDIDYVMRRKPDIIPRRGAAGLWVHPDFEQQYELQWFHGPEGQMIEVYVRRGSHVILSDAY